LLFIVIVSLAALAGIAPPTVTGVNAEIVIPPAGVSPITGAEVYPRERGRSARFYFCSVEWLIFRVEEIHGSRHRAFQFWSTSVVVSRSRFGNWRELYRSIVAGFVITELCFVHRAFAAPRAFAWMNGGITRHSPIPPTSFSILPQGNPPPTKVRFAASRPNSYDGGRED
jgi:hypothetical protein